MEKFKTYTVKSKQTKSVWVFRYHLQGELYSFEVLDGTFSDKQYKWLFLKDRFPYKESVMIDFIPFFKNYFEVTTDLPAITFDYFYELYPRKRTKAETKKYFKTMTAKDKTLAVLGLRKYLNICKLDNRTPVDPIRYLRNRRFEDDY